MVVVVSLCGVLELRSQDSIVMVAQGCSSGFRFVWAYFLSVLN